MITDPMITLAKSKRLIDEILDPVPSAGDAALVLKHYSLYRDRVLESPDLGDAYACMERMLVDMKRLRGGFVGHVAALERKRGRAG